MPRGTHTVMGLPRDYKHYLNNLQIRNTYRIVHIKDNGLLLTVGADKSLARPERKQATATEDFEFHIPYL